VFHNMFRKKETVRLMRHTLENICTLLNYDSIILPDGLTETEMTLMYLEALEQGRHEGFTPVIVPEDDTLEEWLDEEFIGTLHGEDIPDGMSILKKWHHEFGADVISQAAPGSMCDTVEVPLFEPLTRFFPDEKNVRKALIKLPTDKPWEAVQYIPFGGWNACPDPVEMAGVCRYWFEKYGAVPAWISHDTLIMYSPSVVSKEQAMSLAFEQCLFCDDIVSQGCGAIGTLADELRKSRMWYFWWD